MSLTRPADSQPAANDVETVVVTGEQFSLERSIQQKEIAPIITDSISADEIGQIPEFGLGDALRKVPGVALIINNGRGEDQFITIRGLNPDYNSITVDGMLLPSTEETRRQVSLDVLPSVLVQTTSVLKSWTVDQPSDAIGGVTNLRTRSAFDYPGQFIDIHLDGAYWENTEQVHRQLPSGQGDFTYSNRFGSNNEFGFLVMGSYFQRSSSTLNTYTLGYSYYPFSGAPVTEAALEQTSATASNTTLKPGDSVAGTIPIPDRHRWYFYDNDRTRPGAFSRLDFNNEMVHAHLAGGIFEFVNDENRYSQYLNRVGNVSITSATTGSFAQGSPEVDYDKYVQYRQLYYADAGAAVDFATNMHLDATLNYGSGWYKQTTDEDQFTSPTSATYAFAYQLNSGSLPALFIPNNPAAFMNPANYNQVYHLNAIDTSTSRVPQAKVEFKDNIDPGAIGLGFKAGWWWRQVSQKYYYWQYRSNPVGTPPTLAQIGVLPTNVSLYNGAGQTLLLIDPNAVINYVAANASHYTENASDQLSSTVNNYNLTERINALYAEAQYRWENLFALAGLRYETTDQTILNYQPVPFSSTTNFVQSQTASNYAKLLPSLNLAYDVSDALKLRAAVSENLARPQYAQLAENGSASLNAVSDVASESISNPNLRPREAVNYDLSAEYYPAPGVLAAVAVFEKDIQDEIVTLTTTLPNQTVPGFSTPVTLTISQAQNVNTAHVRGLELGVSDVKFTFLPSFLSDFGGTANASFVDMDAPTIRMSDGSFRKLPQLLESAKFVANLALLYSHDRFSGQIAYNYTSKMPISFDTNNAVNDQWWAGITTVDAQIMYKLTENIFVRLQGKNLTDARPQKVVGPTESLNYSTLDNGRAYYFGIGAAF